MSFFGLFGPKTGHQPLYADLCRFHDIDRPTKQVLDRILQAYAVEDSGRIFLDGSLLAKAFTDPNFEENKNLLRELSFRWFGRRL